MEKLVQSTISSLGYLEKDVYYKEPDCFDSIRDLIRLLHNDDARLTVRRICTLQNIVRNDLVPIMRADDTPDELFDASLRLTVNLCQPTLVALNGKLPENAEEWHIYYEAERNLTRLINAFTDSKIFDILSRKCTAHFDMEWEDRSEKNKLLIERIFVLLRFIFAIGTESGRYIRLVELESSLRRKMLLSFFHSQFPLLFLRLCQLSMEREFCLHILAILSLAFKRIDPSMLFLDAGVIEAKFRQETDELLGNLVDNSKKEEQAVRSNNKRNFLKGTFVVQGVKALASTNNLIVQRSKACSPADTINPIAGLASRKRKRRLPARHSVPNLNDVNSHTQEVDEDLLAAVRQFTAELLDDGAFKKLMRITKDIAFASGRSLTHKYSEIYYYSLAAFALRFRRASKMPSNKVSTVFSREAFHDVITYIQVNRENIIVDKQNIRAHALKVQHAITVYKEMLITINFIMNSEAEEEKELSRELCHHIFQTEEYRDLGSNLMNQLKPTAATRKMLEDLVLANHYYIHLMDKVTRSGELIKVQRAKRVVKRRRKTVNADGDKGGEKKEKRKGRKLKKGGKADVELIVHEEKASPSDEELQKKWTAIEPELMDVLSGDVEPTEDISPINVLLKVEDEDHQQFACLQIQSALRIGRVSDAVGLYRAARLLWPETGVFGDDGLGAEEECGELRALFGLDLRPIASTYERCMLEAYGSNAAAHSAFSQPVTMEENKKFEDGKVDVEDQLQELKIDNATQKTTIDDEMFTADPIVTTKNDDGNEIAEDEEQENVGKVAEEQEDLVDELAKGDEEENQHDVIEIPLEFDNYVMSFSKPCIIYWYVHLLKNFETNSTELNKALLKLMHRIVFDLKSPSRFYLASLFCVFRRVDEFLRRIPRDNRKRHQFYEIYIFGFYLMRRFLEHFKERGNVMACELLFTKSAKDAFQIEHGYGTAD